MNREIVYNEKMLFYSLNSMKINCETKLVKSRLGTRKLLYFYKFHSFAYSEPSYGQTFFSAGFRVWNMLALDHPFLDGVY